MKCSACGEKYSDELDFCPFCGAYPKKFCPKCFCEVNDGGKVCSDCGSELLPFEQFKPYHNLKEKALEYKDKNDFEKSAECYERILEEWPNVEEINFLLAENYAFIGETDKALRQYERLENINPEYVGLCSRLAKIYIEKEEIEKAKEYLKKEHKAHPFENEHYIYWMHICFIKDEFEKANRILDRLFAIGPNEDDLLMFKVNNDLNLKYVEYNQELADINERVKEYLEKNFNISI
ncbi:hypothetical protein [Methanobrevibacter sp.]|uniref:tetratricopeptide repeat protein n=1 Tax=Methanobrevibacter sp. TaxID=66852 RepID=UPI0025E739E4|nr:hypothetical protein [Methanobrevibacter sp.]MBQ2962081.1 hypothetical protein [Methanobrevibacter sp.]